ncbi:MBL fold metallo-hydrolase [Streptomyces sp. NPDC058773]|uniref:MBL fold metallo-hydrolase n=1 Tax=Streptomyces sp. NPDC058773 TaxID=3346632 RepID=UPI0036B6FAE3
MREGRQPGDALLQEVAGGIFAYVQPDGGWCLNNAGVIVSDGECALVDTAATETRARALRRAVRFVAPAPPSLVINTHSHGDHTFGNFVFPEAVVIGQERARTEMSEAGLHLTSLWPEVAWGELRLVAPQVVFDRRLTLHIGTVRAELRHPGIAHTAGDATVWLPRERVLFTGDLAMSGVSPFVPMGSVAGSLAALDALRALEPRVVVTGHGPVGGPEILDDTMAYLRLVQRLAEDGLAAGLGPAAIAERAELGRFARWLDAERLVPNLHRALAEACGAEPGSPLDMTALFAEMTAFHGGVPACHA